MGPVLRWLFLPVMLLLCQALTAELWHAARLYGFGFSSLFHPCALAFFSGLALRWALAESLRRLRRHDPLEFVDTLEHELTHALIGYATFAPPVSLSATLKSGGEVELNGSNPLAALAPYYFPLWCHLALLIGFIARASMQGAWSALIFFLLGNFCWRLAKEFRWRQTDLHIYGFFFSGAATLLLLLLNLAVVLEARGLLPWGWVAQSLPRCGREIAQLWALTRAKPA
jgi:hypothetical protein